MNTINAALAKAAAIGLLASVAGIASAGGTQQLDVSATVLKVCKFIPGANMPMVFADIDPSVAGGVSKWVDVPFKCTNGTADTTVTVTSGGAALSNGGESMPYSVAVGAIPAGAGFAAAATLVRVTGTIPATSYQDAKALKYTDTVVLTINN